MKITLRICFLRSWGIGVADMAREIAVGKLGLFSFKSTDGQAIHTWYGVYMPERLIAWKPGVSFTFYGFKSIAKACGKAL